MVAQYLPPEGANIPFCMIAKEIDRYTWQLTVGAARLSFTRYTYTNNSPFFC